MQFRNWLVSKNTVIYLAWESVRKLVYQFYVAIFSKFPWKNTKILRKFCSGTVKWTQVSEDLVPVNISCSQDATGIRFHVTAYNSQVCMILFCELWLI